MSQEERRGHDISTKRQACGLVACMRNEGPFVLEWVAYHKLIGFDPIYVITNDCTDGTDAILDRLHELGEVIHLVNPMHPGLGPQASGMKELLSRPDVQELDWLLHIDADEFIYVSIGEGTIHDLLPVVDHADAVALMWRPFGNNGVERWDDGLVLEMFPRAQAYPQTANANHKTLFRPSRFASAIDHMPKDPKKADLVLVNALGEVGPNAALFSQNKSRYRFPKKLLTWKNACINHYAIRSLDVFLMKNDRGDGMGRLTGEYFLHSRFFRRHNRNAVRERGIWRCLPSLREKLRSYKSDSSLCALHEHTLNSFRKRRDEVLTEENMKAWDLSKHEGPAT